MTDTELIAEARLVAGAATPGPWLNAGWDVKRGHNVLAGKHGLSLCEVYGTGIKQPGRGTMSEDATFIARSRTLIPDLAARLERANARLREWCPEPHTMSGWDDPTADVSRLRVIAEACEIHGVEMPEHIREASERQ